MSNEGPKNDGAKNDGGSRRRKPGGRGGGRSGGRGGSSRGGEKQQGRSQNTQQGRSRSSSPNSQGGRSPSRSQGRPQGHASSRPPARSQSERTAAPAPSTAVCDLGLSAWDMARTRKQQPDTERGQVMTLRTHQRLVEAFEKERRIPEHERSFLRIKENARGSCLFVPGVSSGPQNLRDLAAQLFEADYNVYVLRLPFHDPDGATITTPPWKSVLNQVQQDYRLLSRGGGRVHVIGMGFGAALALHVAAKENVSSLMLMAPALIPRESFFQRLMVRLKLHKLPFVHGWMGWNADLIEGMDQARGKVGKVKVPIFAAQCEDDDRACPTSLRFLQRKSRNPASRFRIFPNGGHAILEAHGEDTLFEDIQKFCRDRD